MTTLYTSNNTTDDALHILREQIRTSNPTFTTVSLPEGAEARIVIASTDKRKWSTLFSTYDVFAWAQTGVLSPGDAVMGYVSEKFVEPEGVLLVVDED